MHILIVCTGNMCRSPMAEAIMSSELERRGEDGFTVSSAGTGAWEGRAASDGALLVGLENHLDISSHRSRHLTRDMVEEADVIFTMARSHLERVKKLGGYGHVHLLGEYAGEKRWKAEVADPYGEPLDVYRDTFDRLQSMIRKAVDRLIETKNAEGRSD